MHVWLIYADADAHSGGGNKALQTSHHSKFSKSTHHLCRKTLESPDSSIETEDLARFGKSLLEEEPHTNRLLAPWMLTCASQLMLTSPKEGFSGATEELCQELVNAAEASNPIRVLHELFAHESMCDPERQRLYADVACYVLGSWCKAFDLKVTTLPYEAVQDMMSLVGAIFRENPVLTRSVAQISSVSCSLQYSDSDNSS
jgi:hypothetical protein